MDDFEIPTFLKKHNDADVKPPKAKKLAASKPRKLLVGVVATPLVILQTFESAVLKSPEVNRCVSALQALNLSAEVVSLLDDLTAVLGTGAKAWAVLLQWLAERLADSFTLSRQGQRLLRQVLKAEDAKQVLALGQKWAATVNAIVGM